MSSKLSLIAVALLAIAAPASRAAGRWDVAFDGGWARCLLDLDAQQQAVTAKVYDATKPGSNNYVMIDDVVVIDRGENYLLQGTITQGTLKIGMGGTAYTQGDQFYLWVAKYTDAVLLVFEHDLTNYWFTQLSWF